MKKFISGNSVLKNNHSTYHGLVEKGDYLGQYIRVFCVNLHDNI